MQMISFVMEEMDAVRVARVPLLHVFMSWNTARDFLQGP